MIPKTLSARTMFWTGIVMLAVGILVVHGGLPVMFALGGETAANSPVYWFLSNLLALVLPPLGISFAAMSLLVKALEARTVVVVTAQAPAASVPPSLAARTVFWVGCSCIVVGVVLALNLQGWNEDLWSSRSLLGDFFSYVVTPISLVFVPLGAALVPISFVLRMLQTEFGRASGAGVLGKPRPPHITRR